LPSHSLKANNIITTKQTSGKKVGSEECNTAYEHTGDIQQKSIQVLLLLTPVGK